MVLNFFYCYKVAGFRMGGVTESLRIGTTGVL